MKQRREERFMRLVAVLCVIIAVLAAFPAVSTGADAKALLSEANTLFRSADKDFMSGKMDSAWETVAKAKEAITAAKEADPSNSQVASLEKRIDQLAVKIKKKGRGVPDSAGRKSLRALGGAEAASGHRRTVPDGGGEGPETD